jgi:hypothetical protein
MAPAVDYLMRRVANISPDTAPETLAALEAAT